jgi:DNA repair protein RecO (recombination protein O)
MKQLVTQAIILSRTDYGEADRIITVLTPGFGKLTLLARGVRRIKSKLAGGIELFSVSEITFIKGRGEVGTLISTRLLKYYGRIVTDLDRTMLGYDLIKQLHKATEDEPEEEYFDLIHEAFEALDDVTIDIQLVKLWFSMQLLRLGGHIPNLQTDTAGNKLKADGTYDFSFDDSTFRLNLSAGRFTVNHIKFLRLGFGGNVPNVLQHIQGGGELVDDTAALVSTMMTAYIHR